MDQLMLLRIRHRSVAKEMGFSAREIIFRDYKQIRRL